MSHDAKLAPIRPAWDELGTAACNAVILPLRLIKLSSINLFCIWITNLSEREIYYLEETQVLKYSK
jgi:hypothetical protein